MSHSIDIALIYLNADQSTTRLIITAVTSQLFIISLWIGLRVKNVISITVTSGSAGSVTIRLTNSCLYNGIHVITNEL